MDQSLLVKIFGHPATLFHSDSTVVDRWLWIKSKLPITRDDEALIDIGCGTGAFTIGSALRGYKALGLSWDDRNQRVAKERSEICKADMATFEVQDVRLLDEREDLYQSFDIAICIENIEHIIDDRKLFKEVALCLKPGGRLLLTAPYYFQRPVTSSDKGPFRKITEDGGHVRRGYTEAMLVELCDDSNLLVENISYCTGFFSQKVTALYRLISRIHPFLAWLVILPLRILPFVFDKSIEKIFKWPGLSICMEAYKPRFN